MLEIFKKNREIKQMMKCRHEYNEIRRYRKNGFFTDWNTYVKAYCPVCEETKEMTIEKWLEEMKIQEIRKKHKDALSNFL